MVWALAFAILLKLLGGGGPTFLVPKLDNYVKKHVVEKSRKEAILVILKDSKKEKKALIKKNKKHFKKLSKLYKSRETKLADFQTILDEILANEQASQLSNITDLKNIQGSITPGEWELIRADIITGFEKGNKKRTKTSAKKEKHFLKIEGKINKRIVDKSKRAKALASVEEMKNVYMRNYKIIQDELINENSIIHQYQSSESELKSLQQEFNELVKEAFQKSFKTHQELVNLTTPEEWKKIF